MEASTGLLWLRIGTGSGMFWMRWWISGFPKLREISWLAENLLASQKGFCYLGLNFLNSSDIFRFSRMSRGSVVSAMTRLRAGQSWGRIPSEATDCLLSRNAWRNSGYHSASCSTVMGILSRAKRGRAVNLTIQIRVLPWLKTSTATPLLVPYAFIAKKEHIYPRK